MASSLIAVFALIGIASAGIVKMVHMQDTVPYRMFFSSLILVFFYNTKFQRIAVAVPLRAKIAKI